MSSDDEDNNSLPNVPDCEIDMNSQTSSCAEVDWTDRDTEMFLNEQTPAEDVPTTSTAPVAPSGIAITPQSRKRPSPTAISGDTKSKIVVAAATAEYVHAINAAADTNDDGIDAEQGE